MDLRTAHRELTANALTTDEPSAFSAQQLLSLNLYELFDVNPEKALPQLYAGLFPTADEDRLFALAELSFLHAKKTEDRFYYMASAVYAAAFLLPGPHGTAPRGIDPGCVGPLTL